jgi:hypothetical protein
MCPKVKRYKGKEMDACWCTKKQQKACLEGDSDSEGKVKKVLRNIGATDYRPKAFILGSS